MYATVIDRLLVLAELVSSAQKHARLSTRFLAQRRANVCTSGNVQVDSWIQGKNGSIGFTKLGWTKQSHGWVALCNG